MLLGHAAGLPYFLKNWFWRVRNPKNFMRTIGMLAEQPPIPVMGDSLLHRLTGPLRRRSIGMDGGFSRFMTLQPVVDHMREGVLAR